MCENRVGAGENYMDIRERRRRRSRRMEKTA
jgi:hypothetical protein